MGIPPKLPIISCKPAIPATITQNSGFLKTPIKKFKKGLNNKEI